MPKVSVTKEVACLGWRTLVARNAAKIPAQTRKVVQKEELPDREREGPASLVRFGARRRGAGLVRRRRLRRAVRVGRLGAAEDARRAPSRVEPGRAEKGSAW